MREQRVTLEVLNIKREPVLKASKEQVKGLMKKRN